MEDTAVLYGRKTQKPPAIPVIDILWITAGLGCDGDTIAMTAATNPSIEDLVLGTIPGIPKVNFHNPVLAYAVGDDFLRTFEQAAEGKLEPFMLVVEGSIPNERNKNEGYWAAMGTDRVTGQPITTCEWIDRLTPKAWAVVTAGTCSAYGGIHALAGNPTGCMGLPDYLGWDWKSRAGIPIVCVPGCPIQPDNFMETLLYLLRQAAGRAPMIPWTRNCGRTGCSPRPSTRAVTGVATTSRPTSRRTTARPNALSSRAAGARWSSATSASAAG